MRYTVVTPRRAYVFNVESGHEVVNCLLKEYVESDKMMGDWNDRLIAHFVNQPDLTSIVAFINSLTRYPYDEIIGIYKVSESEVVYENLENNR